MPLCFLFRILEKCKSNELRHFLIWSKAADIPVSYDGWKKFCFDTTGWISTLKRLMLACPNLETIDIEAHINVDRNEASTTEWLMEKMKKLILYTLCLCTSSVVREIFPPLSGINSPTKIGITFIVHTNAALFQVLLLLHFHLEPRSGIYRNTFLGSN